MIRQTQTGKRPSGRADPGGDSAPSGGLPAFVVAPETTGELLLQTRRISPDTVDAFQIVSDHWHQGRPGWLYPADPANPAAGCQWKAYNGKPKYLWPDGKPAGVTYYHPPALAEAVSAAGGVLWIVSGVADLWACHSAGLQNALCWFGGETAVPADLVPALHSLGVLVVHCAPDRDETGRRGAGKLASALQDSGIALVAHQLPGEPESGVDIGHCWAHYTRPPASFAAWLLSECPAYTPELEPTRAPSATVADTPWLDDWLGQLESMITAALGITERKASGFSPNISCPNPDHPDRTPSAAWNFQNHTLHCAVCGDVKAVTVHQWLELPPPSADLQAERRAGASAPALSAQSRQKLLQTGDTAAARVLDALYTAGHTPGSTITAKDITAAGVPLSAAYAALKAQAGIFFCFVTPFSLEHTSYDKTKKNKHTGRGRPPALYRVPSPAEVAERLGLDPTKEQAAPLPAAAARTAKDYRTAVYRGVMIRRNGKPTPRASAGRWLGVSARTVTRYDEPAGVKAHPYHDRRVLDAGQLAALPDDRTAAKPNQWLETADGTKYPPTRTGGQRAQANSAGAPVFLVSRLANKYEVLPLSAENAAQAVTPPPAIADRPVSLVSPPSAAEAASAPVTGAIPETVIQAAIAAQNAAYKGQFTQHTERAVRQQASKCATVAEFWKRLELEPPADELQEAA